MEAISVVNVRYLTLILSTLLPGHALQHEEMLHLPDHLGALQVDLYGVRVEHHPLELPLGFRHVSVHLGVIKKPLKTIFKVKIVLFLK